VKLETFFKKFDIFTDAPNAVAQMREAVLLLAIRGKLSIQSPTESCEPQLSKAYEFAKGSDKQITEAIQPAFSIPANWGWVPLGHCMHLVNGKAFKPSEWATEGTPIIRIQNLNKKDAPFNYCEGKVEPKFQVRSGDLLISWSGTPGTSFGAFVWDRGSAVLNQHIFRCELVNGVFQKEYLQLSVNGRLDEMISRAHGAVGLRHITKGELENIALPLPPLAEQKRIVAKVDELMALCDRLEQQQQERETRHTALARASLTRFAEAPTPKNLNFLFDSSFSIQPSDLRKSILTLAVQGKIVSHDAAIRRWKTRKLKEITTKIGSGSTPSGGKQSYQRSGVPLIRSMNVHFAGFVRDGLAFLTDEQANKLKGVIVKAEDVLLNITGASIGRVTTAPKDMDGARVNQHVCIVRPTTEILPAFLQLFLASPVVQNLIADVQVGATREALTKGMIEQFEIPVPSVAEQRRIVAKVDQLMALVDQLEVQLTASRTTAEKLMEALVSELATPVGTPQLVSGK
jgi:type I restriction enzyme S subunit